MKHEPLPGPRECRSGQGVCPLIRKALYSALFFLATTTFVLLPTPAWPQETAPEGPSNPAGFALLESRGIDLDPLFDSLWQTYKCTTPKQGRAWSKAVEESLGRHRAYLNLNILIAMAITGDDHLTDHWTMPFYRAMYEDDPRQLTADEAIGQAIAETVAGQDGIRSYRAVRSSMGSAPPLADRTPLVKQMLLGLLGGIAATVNAREGFIRVTQTLDYGPASKATEERTFFVPARTTQQALLEATASLISRRCPDHGRIIEGINGVRADKDAAHFWLSNINGVHLFNVSPRDYILTHGDVVRWYFGADTGDERTK